MKRQKARVREQIAQAGVVQEERAAEKKQRRLKRPAAEPETAEVAVAPEAAPEAAAEPEEPSEG
jgi:hypothetical protein